VTTQLQLINIIINISSEQMGGLDLR